MYTANKQQKELKKLDKSCPLFNPIAPKKYNIALFFIFFLASGYVFEQVSAKKTGKKSNPNSGKSIEELCSSSPMMPGNKHKQSEMLLENRNGKLYAAEYFSPGKFPDPHDNEDIDVRRGKVSKFREANQSTYNKKYDYFSNLMKKIVSKYQNILQQLTLGQHHHLVRAVATIQYKYELVATNEVAKKEKLGNCDEINSLRALAILLNLDEQKYTLLRIAASHQQLLPDPHVFYVVAEKKALKKYGLNTVVPTKSSSWFCLENNEATEFWSAMMGHSKICDPYQGVYCDFTSEKCLERGSLAFWNYLSIAPLYLNINNSQLPKPIATELQQLNEKVNRKVVQLCKMPYGKTNESDLPEKPFKSQSEPDELELSTYILN